MSQTRMDISYNQCRAPSSEHPLREGLHRAPPTRRIPQGDEAYKQQNQADRIGLPDFISYSQRITEVTHKNVT